MNWCQRNGFLMVLLAVECGGQVYLSDDGDFYYMTSPNYPSNYLPDKDCYWLIESASSILISIIDFRTEFSWDRLKFVGDTLHGRRGMTFELHGTTKIRTISFISSVVQISFKSDYTVSFPGFSLLVFSNFTANGKSLR